MVITSSNSKELLSAINIVAEVEVVDLVSISLIAISLEKHVQNLVSG